MPESVTKIGLVAFLGVALSIFVGFVYAYPALFPHLDAGRPAHFEERVQIALDAGEYSEAIAIARNAAHWQPLDPMAHTVLGNALAAAGRQNAAREAYQAALNVPTTPGPEYFLTHKPFYFAAARLRLAALASDGPDPSSSLLHIEFARPYVESWQDSLATFAEPVYDIYSDYEWWTRALDYGRPDAGDRESLAPPSLLRLAWAAMAGADYALVDEITIELAEHEGYREDAALLAGIAALRRENWSEASTHLSTAKGIHGGIAAYYGTQVRSGVDSKVAADSMWSPLAKLGGSGDSRALADWIDSESNRLATASTYRAETPVAARWSELEAVSPGYFPIRIAWKHRKNTLALDRSDPSLELTLVELNDSRLTYEWVRNEAPWLPSLLAAQGIGEMPGWADIARDWYAFRQRAASECLMEGDEIVLRITNDDIHKTALLYSNPVRCDPRHGFLLRGEVRAGTAPAILGWEALDDHERVVSSGFIFDQEETESWKQGTLYIEPTHFHDRIRVIIGVNRHEGYADFRGLQLLRVTPPPR